MGDSSCVQEQSNYRERVPFHHLNKDPSQEKGKDHLPLLTDHLPQHSRSPHLPLCLFFGAITSCRSWGIKPALPLACSPQKHLLNPEEFSGDLDPCNCSRNLILALPKQLKLKQKTQRSLTCVDIIIAPTKHHCRPQIQQ